LNPQLGRHRSPRNGWGVYRLPGPIVSTKKNQFFNPPLGNGDLPQTNKVVEKSTESPGKTQSETFSWGYVRGGKAKRVKKQVIETRPSHENSFSGKKNPKKGLCWKTATKKTRSQGAEKKVRSCRETEKNNKDKRPRLSLYTRMTTSRNPNHKLARQQGCGGHRHKKRTIRGHQHGR